MAVWRSLDSAQALVSVLWHLEMGNILSRAIRRNRITREALADCWARLGEVGLQTLPAHGDAQHWSQRAADWGLSAYDACYLELAIRADATFATLDKRLARAALTENLTVVCDLS